MIGASSRPTAWRGSRTSVVTAPSSATSARAGGSTRRCPPPPATTGGVGRRRAARAGAETANDGRCPRRRETPGRTIRAGRRRVTGGWGCSVAVERVTRTSGRFARRGRAAPIGAARGLRGSTGSTRPPRGSAAGDVVEGRPGRPRRVALEPGDERSAGVDLAAPGPAGGASPPGATPSGSGSASGTRARGELSGTAGSTAAGMAGGDEGAGGAADGAGRAGRSPTGST